VWAWWVLGLGLVGRAIDPAAQVGWVVTCCFVLFGRGGSVTFFCLYRNNYYVCVTKNVTNEN